MNIFMSFLLIILLSIFCYSLWNTAKEEVPLGGKPDFINLWMANAIVFIFNKFSKEKRSYFTLAQLEESYNLLKNQ